MLMILTLTLLKGRSFIIQDDFESCDIVISLDQFCNDFGVPPKKRTFCDIVQNSTQNTKLLRGQNKKVKKKCFFVSARKVNMY